MCSLRYLDCGSSSDDERKHWANGTELFKICNPSNKTRFNYGIFGDAVEKGVVSSNFIEKYFYCLWWGLQNLRYGYTFI